MTIKDPAELVVGETYNVQYYLLPPSDIDPEEVFTAIDKFQAKFIGRGNFWEGVDDERAKDEESVSLEFDNGQLISFSATLLVEASLIDSL